MGVIKYKIERTEHQLSMPAPLRIKLKPEEEKTLAELREAISVPYRTRDRTHTNLI